MDSGDTGWILTSAGLVMLMTPGLALFYGGMVRAKSVLNMMMMSFGSLALIGVLWVLYGYSVAFGDDVGGGLLGDPFEYLGLRGLMDPEAVSGAAPVMAFVGLKAIDFAGGTAVHINAGAAGLALALVLGVRRGFGKEAMRPHNLPLVMLGAGLLWFGWFGFNAGSALAADATAALAWVNTLGATGAACLGWLVTERIRDRHSTSLGAASGVVAGLVAITPAAHSVSPVGAILIGAVAGGLCAMAVGLKYRFGFDDSLDVVGVHLVGGLWGTLAIGLFATSAAPAGVAGLFHGGGFDQLWRQAVGAFTVLAVSFVVTYVLAQALHRTMGLRIHEDDEVAGIDATAHAEQGYDLTAYGSGGLGRPSALPAGPAIQKEVSA